MKKQRKLYFKILIPVLSAILFLSAMLFGAYLYFTLPIKDYYNASEKEFIIPDINKGFVPQGMDYDKSSDKFFISGFATKGASPVYLLDRANGKYKKLFLLDDKGNSYSGHSGGIAVHNKYVYITHEMGLLVYSYNDMLSANDGDTLNCLGYFSTKFSDTDYIKCSFVDVTDNKLIVGEYFKEKSYPTLDTHKITTSAGDKNVALAVEFSLSYSSTYEFGINPTPNKALSLPDKVQSMTYNDNKYYLSRSYGASFSIISEHDKNNANYVDKITVLGKEVSLYALDGKSLVKDYKMPAMSEEIVFINNRIWVMNESASNKYFFGKFLNAKWCYSTDLTKMNNN